MRATVFLIAVLTATTVTAQTPRKKACELLSAADVEAVLGVSPLRSVDPSNTGKNCLFQKVVNQSVFTISSNTLTPPMLTQSSSG